MRSKRIDWIDGIKVYACIFVFWFHYRETFTQIDNISGVLELILKVTSQVLNGNFWVFVFMILSGVLASNKDIENLPNLFKTCVRRYFTFVVMFLELALVIALIGLIIGYRSDKYVEIEFLAYSFHGPLGYNLKDFLKMVFLLDRSIVNVLWMIRPLFFGNCLIYLKNYFKSNNKAKIVYCVFIVLLLSLFSIITEWENFIYILATFLGSFYNEIWKVNISEKKGNIIFIIIALVYSGLRIIASRFIPVIGDLVIKNFIYGLLIVYFANYSSILKRICTIKPIRLASKLSLPIYLLHWPVICSFSLFVRELILPYANVNVAFVLNLFMTTAVVLGLAYLWGKFVEPISKKLLNF